MNVIIDEVAKQAFALCDKYDIKAPSHREMFACGYRYGLRANLWHKASEELPKEGGHYLCMDDNKHIVQLAFRGTKWVNTSQFIDIDLCLVKYWMKIPELPKED